MGGRGGSSDLSYQGKNGGSGRASSIGVNVSDMKNRLSSLPDNVINSRLAQEAVSQIEQIKDGSSNVKIYRATVGDSINQNDWVFLSRQQAERWTKTALGRPKPGVKVIEATVKARDVDWTGKNYRKHWVGAYLQEAGIQVVPTIRPCAMGGRGASSGISEKGHKYGSQYHSLFTSGNIKFVEKNNRQSESLLETQTSGRVYVTVGGNDLLQVIYFDKANRRSKTIDLTHYHAEMNPHTHHGYTHNERNGPKGATRLSVGLSVEERAMIERIRKIWHNHLSRR